MRLLLDTHAAVWSASSSHRLPPTIRDMIADPQNEVFVSLVSLWEIAIKNDPERGQRMPFSAVAAAAIFEELGYAQLGITAAHVIEVEGLPPIHRDPFDRLLVAQSLSEPMRLVTHDERVAAYSDTTILF